MSVPDENKTKLIGAGVLKHYVELLSSRDEAVQQAAAHGLWLLAFKCRDVIIKEPKCLEGRYAIALITIIILFASSRVVTHCTARGERSKCRPSLRYRSNELTEYAVIGQYDICVRASLNR